ncbi:unnamed protein product [Rotaria socialis]|uniref:Uncharacterized protein n=1 Tax=Rotaria socialis TaxID=392032 RepID=A0A818AE46_9BILA|nr:unnamed protein product [Rotaria socialis]CAF4939077.1 unnamed protein product [Rotaria socialis]
MSRLDYRSKHNWLRRLPTVRSGLLLLCIEGSGLSLSMSKKFKETIIQINDLHKYHMICYTSTSKCIRYLKEARIYERIIIIMVINKIATENCETPDNDFILRVSRRLNYNISLGKRYLPSGNESSL